MSKELKEKNEKELSKMLADNQENLRSFRFGIAGSKNRNVKEGRAIRKDIARIQTEMSARKKAK
jgi:ribosomal protein L29